ncbi:hypothetical protein D3C75_1006390 [compost metagenome]
MLSPQPVNAMFVGFSDYEELSSEVYVEPSISDNTKNKILMDLEQSKEKVIEVFDVIEAHPTIIFVQSSDAIRTLCTESNRSDLLYVLGKLHCDWSAWI